MMNAREKAEQALGNLKVGLREENEAICCPKCDRPLDEVGMGDHRKGFLFYCVDCVQDHDTYIIAAYITVIFFVLGYFL